MLKPVQTSVIPRAINLKKASAVIMDSSTPRRVWRQGEASQAAGSVPLKDRPRKSHVDDFLDIFRKDASTFDAHIRVEQAKWDREAMANIAEAQTRLLVEADVETSSSSTPSVSDEVFLTRLEVHQDEISRLVWEALSQKTELEDRSVYHAQQGMRQVERMLGETGA